MIVTAVIFFFSTIIVLTFINSRLHLRKKIVSSIFILALTFNFYKNFIRISENNFVNNPYEMIKPYVGKQTRKKLGEFEYFNGWYGNSPVGKVNLENSFKHKKKFIFDIIYKKN